MFDCTAWYECHWDQGWLIALGANGIIALAYLAIALTILMGLRASGQWRSNPLARATGAIFLTCGVGHGFHALHLLGPTVGLDTTTGLAARAAFADLHYWIWGPITAVAAVTYWTLRGRFPALVRGTVIFEDMRERQRQALEIHDNIVQGLAEAKLALERGDREASLEDLDRTLEASKRIITDLLGEEGSEIALGPGDLQRERPAGVGKAP